MPSTATPFVPERRRAHGRATLVLSGLAGAVLAVTVAVPARAQPASPEDWPCIQVLVPEVLPAVLWPVPIGPALAGSWRDTPAVRDLATRLGEAEGVDDEARAAIDAFAGSFPETAREDALTRLADGTVSVANERRGRYLEGIRRYTRQQIAIAGQIESTLNRLAELDDEVAGGGALDPRRAEIEETLAWHERLYDQRERSIRALCERPVALEEMLSEMLREMAYRLPGA